MLTLSSKIEVGWLVEFTRKKGGEEHPYSKFLLLKRYRIWISYMPRGSELVMGGE